MSKKNIGKHFLQIDKQFNQWYENVENAQIDEMLNFKTLIETNEKQILNYFREGEMNAMAEAINSKIQKFNSSNQGTRDRDFFFRLDKYFTWHIKILFSRFLFYKYCSFVQINSFKIFEKLNK